MTMRTAEDFELTKGEIKKVERLANKFSGRTDCKVTGYFAKSDDAGWMDVVCEICYSYEQRASFDINLCSKLEDARKSFARIPYDAEYIAPEESVEEDELTEESVEDELTEATVEEHRKQMAEFLNLPTMFNAVKVLRAARPRLRNTAIL